MTHAFSQSAQKRQYLRRWTRTARISRMGYNSEKTVFCERTSGPAFGSAAVKPIPGCSVPGMLLVTQRDQEVHIQKAQHSNTFFFPDAIDKFVGYPSSTCFQNRKSKVVTRVNRFSREG